MKVKYPSIENSYREKHIEWVRLTVPDHIGWEVTEKVHGANFFIYMSKDGEVRYGKKSGLLGNEENFYGHQAVMLRIGDRLEKILKRCREDYENPEKEVIGFAIFGEICGGSYNHPDIERDPNASIVQQGIFYSPHNEFYAFDIGVFFEDGMKIFYPTKIRNDIFDRYGILYAKPLFKGSLNECLEYNPYFESHIGEWLDLPKIEDNFAEGVVIKPCLNYFFANGKRVILKNKTDKHKEQQKKKKKVTPKLNEKQQEVYDAAREFVTVPRFENVESHHGYFEFKDFKRLSGLYTKDLMEDFLKDHQELVDSLEKVEWKEAVKFLSKDINILLRNCLQR